MLPEEIRTDEGLFWDAKPGSVDAEAPIRLQAPRTLYVTLLGVTTSFFAYSYPLLEPIEATPWGFGLAGLSDIAAMKLDAAAGRGSRKDFIDLYFLCRQFDLSRSCLEQLVESHPQTALYHDELGTGTGGRRGPHRRPGHRAGGGGEGARDRARQSILPKQFGVVSPNELDLAL